MNRREFGNAGLAAAAVAGLGSTALAQNAKAPKAAEGHGEHHDAMMTCAKACSDCQRECDACATHCANQAAAGKKEHLASLMTCRDCADFCATAAQIVARSGPFAGLICDSCAEACARCAKACQKFPDDAHMKQCANECVACEKACREMLKHVDHAA